MLVHPTALPRRRMDSKGAKTPGTRSQASSKVSRRSECGDLDAFFVLCKWVYWCVSSFLFLFFLSVMTSRLEISMNNFKG